MLKLDREKLAWAAGFFDGEGTIITSSKGKLHADGTRRSYVALQVCQASNYLNTPPTTLIKFHDAINRLGYLRSLKRKYKPHHKPQWYIREDTFEKVQAIIAMLWVFLCEEKKIQIKTIFEKFYSQPPPLSPSEAGKRNIKTAKRSNGRFIKWKNI